MSLTAVACFGEFQSPYVSGVALRCSLAAGWGALGRQRRMLMHIVPIRECSCAVDGLRLQRVCWELMWPETGQDR